MQNTNLKNLNCIKSPLKYDKKKTKKKNILKKTQGKSCSSEEREREIQKIYI